MSHFRCQNCGCKIKAPDEYAGRKGKCPKCHQNIEIPVIGKETLTQGHVTIGTDSQSAAQNAVGITARQDQKCKTSETTKKCPYCGETILAVARKCKHCGEFLDESLRVQSTAAKVSLDPTQLREEYERLVKERKIYKRFGFYFGIPGFIMGFFTTFIFILFTGLYKQYAAALFFVSLAGTISMGVGFSYFAKYKGRSPWLGLLVLIPFWIISIIILLLLKDFKKEGMIEIDGILKGTREPKTLSYSISQRPVKTSGLAIASLVLGICGLFTAGLTAIVGFILGIIGLRAINKNAGRLGGRGLAIAGITTSSVGLLFMIIIFVSAISNVRDIAKTMVSTANVRQMCMGMQIYIQDNKGRFPPADSWTEKLRAYNCQEKVFTSPHNPNAGRAYAINAHLSGKQEQQIRWPDKTVLIFEARFDSPPGGGLELLPEKPRGRRGYVIGFADFHIESVPADGLDELIWKP